MHHLTMLAVTLLGPAPAGAEPVATPDKSGYHLFDPTPRELWRPMSADRPDVTESPRTVDAGAVQLELSFFEYAHDSHNATADKTDALLLAASNLKVGLLDNADLQIVFAPYERQETRPDGGGPAVVDEGVSDLFVRLKVNLWGNDEGETALGILPFVKIPAGTSVSDGRAAGGVALPFAWDFHERISLGVMPQLDVAYNEASGTHDVAVLLSAVLGFEIHGPLAGYVEHVSVVTFNGGDDYEALLSLGGTYEVTPNAVLDAGARIGLNRDADDLAVFTGITLRF